MTLCYLDKWWAFFEHPHACMPNCPIAHNKTLCLKEPPLLYFISIVINRTIQTRYRSICRESTQQKKKRKKREGESLGRIWGDEGSLRWHSCHGLWIKDESFDLAPSFPSPPAHLNYYRGALEENRVSKYTLKWRRCETLREIFHSQYGEGQWLTVQERERNPQTQGNITIWRRSTYILQL